MAFPSAFLRATLGVLLGLAAAATGSTPVLLALVAATVANSRV